MTRQKKTRSLKRIHSVKTGNPARLKREANFDRQTGKRVKNRVPSVYEKFLAENPEAKEQEIARNTAAQNAAKARTEPVDNTASATPKAPATPVIRASAEEDKRERSKTLLEQLDSKDFKDIY
jgi:hypothetical protein